MFPAPRVGSGVMALDTGNVPEEFRAHPDWKDVVPSITDAPTLGEGLRLAREQSGQSLAQLAAVTRVPPPAQRASEPTMEIRGEFLHAFMDTERLKSHKPVTLTRGGNVFHADAGMDYDNQKRVLELTGNVRGTLQPPAP